MRRGGAKPLLECPNETSRPAILVPPLDISRARTTISIRSHLWLSCISPSHALFHFLLVFCDTEANSGRYVALRQYEPAFQSKLDEPIYFNWETDTLLFTSFDTAVEFLTISLKDPPRIYSECRTKLQHFKMTTSLTWGKIVSIGRLSCLACLKTITIEQPNGFGDSSDALSTDQVDLKSRILKAWIGSQEREQKLGKRR